MSAGASFSPEVIQRMTDVYKRAVQELKLDHASAHQHDPSCGLHPFHRQHPRRPTSNAGSRRPHASAGRIDGGSELRLIRFNQWTFSDWHGRIDKL